MYDIQFHIQASEEFSEVQPGTLQEAECMVEDIVGCALLQIFDSLCVVTIVVRHVPTGQMTIIQSTQGV